MSSTRDKFDQWLYGGDEYRPSSEAERSEHYTAWLAWRASRRATLEEVLRGLQAEDDSAQLRAIIASVSAMLAHAYSND